MNILSKITVVAIGILAGMYLSGCGSDNTSPGSDNGIGSCMTHNDIGYCDVTSPYTGKVWLNKNLGAARVCTAYDDTECYGDYYQWGRKHDGHQDKNSEITKMQAEYVNNAGSRFIIWHYDWPYDWVEWVDSDGTERSANWSKTDGNYACPAGYRVPTIDELKTETIDQGVSNNIDAFNNFLKLPSVGLREGESGDMLHQGSSGNVWSSSVSDYFSIYLSFDYIGAMTDNENRTYGLPVRCIKN